MFRKRTYKTLDSKEHREVFCQRGRVRSFHSAGRIVVVAVVYRIMAEMVEWKVHAKVRLKLMS